MVLGGALLATLALSFAGLIALRYLGPQNGFRAAATLLGALILCATLGLGLIQSRLLLRPVTALSGQAAALRHNPQHPAAPLQHFGTSELRDLAHSITTMAEALQHREAQIHSFTDHVTLERKTPVTAIRAAAELLSDGTPNPEDQTLIAQILGATNQMQPNSTRCAASPPPANPTIMAKRGWPTCCQTCKPITYS
jgi:signal transduction histidine kinase